MNPTTKLTAGLAACILAVPCANAQFTQIDISSQVNADIQTYSGGANYQLGGTTLNVAGVPFALAELNNDPATTGVVQSPANDGPFDFTFNAPAGTTGTAVYTLINTAFGVFPGFNEGSIVVTGSHGETATLNLTQGVNTRDHFEDGFVNTLTDPTVVPTYFANGAPAPSGSDRLDRQVLILPASFTGDTIASIDFEAPDSGTPQGEPFLAGITIGPNVPDSAIPLPMFAGLLGMLAAARGFFKKSA